MTKKITALVLTVLLLIFTVPSASAESYWSAMDAYKKALDSGDDVAIIAAVDRIGAVYPFPSNETEYKRVAFPYENAGKSCEKLGRYSDSVKYYKKALRCIKWLNDHGNDYSDGIRCLEALIEHNEGIFEVYAETEGAGDVPFHGAINEPAADAGTFFGVNGENMEGNQSSRLIYVEFFTNEISDFNWQLPKDNSQLIEIAWNVPHETYADLEEVVSNVEYLERNARWLSTKEYKFLVRFGAEMNCWKDLDNYSTPELKARFCAKFKEAFIAVANAIHQYAPNAAVVFSPNYTSNWLYDVDDFYPGDQYVDWVGMSSYCNVSAAAKNTSGVGTDAWYCRGYYENQLLKIKSIIDTYGDRKPIMISECGNKYSDDSGLQTEQHAASTLKYFYTYINMFFPQVRAVLHFNANFKDDFYSLRTNETLRETYMSVTKSNTAMQRTVASGNNYVSLKNYAGSASGLTLYTLRYLPGSTARVTYELDGKVISSNQSYPYKCVINNIDYGIHKLTVTTVNGKETSVKGYLINSDGADNAAVTACDFTDVAKSAFYEEAVNWAVVNNVTSGVSATSFAPAGNCTRGQMVTFLWRAFGSPVSKNRTHIFSDIKEGAYYYDAILWAVENNITNGTSDKTFSPNAKVTRGQAVTFLFRASGASDANAQNSAKFSDVKPGTFYYDAVGWAASAGVTKGTSETKFSPNAVCTRGQIVTFLYRAINKN